MAEVAIDTKRRALNRFIRPAVVDRAEQVVVALLWALLLQRVLNSSNPLALLLLLSETAVVAFVLVRRSSREISIRLGDWLVAVTGTVAPLLVMPGPSLFPALVPLGIALVAFGNLFQVWAKLYLRRSFGIAPANRGVKAGGPYRIVRHPMYTGYMIANVGLLMLMPSLINLAIYAIAWWAQVLRVIAEERHLSADPAYRELMGKVRYRLIPGIF